MVRAQVERLCRREAPGAGGSVLTLLHGGITPGAGGADPAGTQLAFSASQRPTLYAPPCCHLGHPQETRMDMLEPGRFGFAVPLQEALRQLHRRQVGAAGRRASTSTNITPITGKPFCEVAALRPPRTSSCALDAAHAAKADAGAAPRRPSAPTSCCKIADRMEQNLELLAMAETVDNGKPIRETLAADLPLADRPLPLLRRLHPRAGRRASARSTTTPSPTTSTSRWAWSARSSRGTSRC